MKIRDLLRASLFALVMTLSHKASGQVIYGGVKGPTNWQLDERFVFSRGRDGNENFVGNSILKYWDGDKLGKWAFLNLPYRAVETQGDSDQGFGDLSFGLGPRGRIKDLHWFLYGSLTTPTADNKSGVKLGNDRYDTKLGFQYTYLTEDRRFELDGLFERNFTGENNRVNVSNETSFGLLGGMRLFDKVRVVTGFTELQRDNGDFLLSSRSALRYTFSSKFHLELMYDQGLKNDVLPMRNNLAIFLRYNF